MKDEFAELCDSYGKILSNTIHKKEFLDEYIGRCLYKIDEGSSVLDNLQNEYQNTVNESISSFIYRLEEAEETFNLVDKIEELVNKFKESADDIETKYLTLKKAANSILAPQSNNMTRKLLKVFNSQTSLNNVVSSTNNITEPTEHIKEMKWDNINIPNTEQYFNNLEKQP